jgi:radical SAM protein with 4Fe4S-binding SPASM domain
MVRTPGFYRRTLESIENAVTAGHRVSSKSVITPYNILTIPRLYRELKDLGVQEVRLASYCRSGYHHTDDLYNHTESFDWLTREIEILRQEYPDDEIRIQNGGPVLAPLPKEERVTKWPTLSACAAGRNTMLICVDGKVIPCEQMPETEDSFCGDLNTQSLEDIWHGEELAKRTLVPPLEEFEGTRCYDCSIRHECHTVRGTCIRDNAMYYGSMYTPSEYCPEIELPFVRRM